MDGKKSASQLRKLLKGGKKHTYPKGQVIQYSDDRLRLTLVKKGYVKRYMISNDGSLAVQAIYTAGDIFPLTHIYKLFFSLDIYEGDEVYYYETMAPNTELYVIDDDTFKKEVKADNALYKELLLVAGQRLQSNIQQLENLSLKSSYARVAHQLIFLAHHYGERRVRGVKICVPLTQQDLADILGITRETVSLAVSRLRKKKILGSKGFVVLNMKKLQHEANTS